MITPKKDEEKRLRDLSRIADMAHKYGSLGMDSCVNNDASNLKKLKVEFKKPVCEREDVQKKLYLSYGL